MPKFNPNPTPLEKARRAAGLTRAQLAEKSGVKLATIKQYENLRNNINNGRAIIAAQLADAIGVSVRSILNDEEVDDA